MSLPDGCDDEQAVAGEEESVLASTRFELTYYEFSQSGQHQAFSSQAGCASVTWSSARLRLHLGQSELSSLELKWADVSGVWASVKCLEGRGFSVEVALETKGGACACDYLRFRGRMNAAGGHLLALLEEMKADKLKVGRSPDWVMSRWAAPLYRNGISSNRLRVVLGWLSTIIEVIFAAAFLAQLQSIVVSRERRLVKEIHMIFKGLDFSFFSICLLLQHIVVFFIFGRSLWTSLVAAVKSLNTFHQAGMKASKSIKKKLASMPAPAGDTGKGEPGDQRADAASANGEGVRLRKGFTSD